MRTSRILMVSTPLAVALLAAPALAHGPHGGGACRQALHALCAQSGTTPGPGGCLQTLCPGFTSGHGGEITH